MPLKAVELRPYRTDDLESILQLDELCFAEEFRFDRQTMRLFAEARNASTILAADSDDNLLGFVIAHIKRSTSGLRGYILTIDVDEHHRRSGLASRLMQSAEDALQAAGAMAIELHVFVDNHGAISFYERMAYLRQGKVRGFYGKGVDAWLYLKRLEQPS